MKKFTAILLVMAVVLAVSGCASKEEPAATEAPVAQAPVRQVPAATEAAEAPEVGVMAYADFLAAELQDVVCVETYVQGHQSWWDNKITLYCQDQEGAYFLYDLACSEEEAAKLLPGTKIRVTGDKAILDGRIEILNGRFAFVEDGDTYLAEPLDVTDLLGTEELIDHQNKVVAFQGLTVEAVAQGDGDDLIVTLGHNGISLDFCVESYLTGPDSEVYITVNALEVGEVVNVEGFLYWSEGVNPHITAIALAA